MIALYALLSCLGLVVFSLLFWPLISSRTTALRGIAATLLCTALCVGLYSVVGTPQYAEWEKAANDRAEHAKNALKRAQEALTANPKDPIAHVEAARALMDMQQPKAAIAHLKQAAIITQGTPEVLLMLGKAELFANGGIINQPARNAFKIVLLQVPDSTEARFYLALDTEQQGETARARKTYQELLASPNLPAALREAVQTQLTELESAKK